MSSSGSSPKLDGDGAGVASIEIFLTDDPALLAGRNVERQRVAVMDHDAVAADVDPAFVDIAGNDEVGRADISAAVLFMPMRHRQREEVDVLAFVNIFQHRSRLDRPAVGCTAGYSSVSATLV